MIFHQTFNSNANYSFNIAIYSDTVWENHFHKNLELIYILKGNLTCTLNSTTYKMTAGDFGLCLPYDIHSYVPQKGCEYWILVFSGDFVHSFSKEIVGKIGNGCVFRAKKTIERYVKEQLINNPHPTKYTLKSCLYAICEEYLAAVPLTQKDAKKVEIIVRIADYVFEKHTAHISLQDVATVFGYDYNYMSRLFKNVFNIPFTDFVNSYRLETAIELLETTNESIVEIALNSGFQSVRSFNVFFKRNLNITPSEYRKNHTLSLDFEKVIC